MKAEPAEPALGIAPQRFPVRIYYEDTDFSGFVYYASYLRFLERGRTEFLRAIGIEHSSLMESGIYFVVRAMTIEFLKPALMDDELCVVTSMTALHGASLDMWQEIRRDTALLLTAKVKVALTAGGKACRIPEVLRNRLRAWAPGSSKLAPPEGQGL